MTYDQRLRIGGMKLFNQFPQTAPLCLGTRVGKQIFGPRPWTSRTDELLKESEVTEQKSAESSANKNTNQ